MPAPIGKKIGALASLSFLLSGCVGVCMHPRESVNTATEAVRRANPRQRATDFKHAIQDGSLRDKDFLGYVGFVVTELRLKDVLQYKLGEEGWIRGYRLQVVDGFGGADGAEVAARLEVEPDWGLVVNEGVKLAFGFWGRLLPDKMVTGIARDLTEGNRFVGQFLDVGVDEVDLDFTLVTASGEIPLGRATTDVGGRAALKLEALPSGLVPGSYAVTAAIAPSRPPMKFDAARTPVEAGAGRLFIPREGEQVVVVNVSNTVFALDSAAAFEHAIARDRYHLMDRCTATGLQSLSDAGYRVIYLSGNPEGMAPLVRDELARRELLFDSPLLFKPVNVDVTKETTEAFKARELAAVRDRYGAENVLAYIGDDPEQDGGAAKTAGVRFVELPARADGGWCGHVADVIR